MEEKNKNKECAMESVANLIGVEKKLLSTATGVMTSEHGANIEDIEVMGRKLHL